MERRNERASARQGTDRRDAPYAFASGGTATTKLGPPGGEPPAAPAPDTVDRPLSLLLFLIMWPFWLFRDASRGDRLARAAAYRHNRAMRVHLPGYLLRWFVGAGIVFALMAAAESAAGLAAPLSMLLVVALGVVFAASVCVLFVTAYIYWYLSRNEEV